MGGKAGNGKPTKQFMHKVEEEVGGRKNYQYIRSADNTEDSSPKSLGLRHKKIKTKE